MKVPTHILQKIKAIEDHWNRKTHEDRLILMDLASRSPEEVQAWIEDFKVSETLKDEALIRLWKLRRNYEYVYRNRPPKDSEL